MTHDEEDNSDDAEYHQEDSQEEGSLGEVLAKPSKWSHLTSQRNVLGRLAKLFCPRSIHKAKKEVRSEVEAKQ